MDRKVVGDVMGKGLAEVALRKESVDRKVNLGNIATTRTLSLSARRAWIEKSLSTPWKSEAGESLSARRAWIENLLQ